MLAAVGLTIRTAYAVQQLADIAAGLVAAHHVPSVLPALDVPDKGQLNTAPEAVPKVVDPWALAGAHTR